MAATVPRVGASDVDPNDPEFWGPPGPDPADQLNPRLKDTNTFASLVNVVQRTGFTGDTAPTASETAESEADGAEAGSATIAGLSAKRAETALQSRRSRFKDMGQAVTADLAAEKMRFSSKLKALKQTPHPMILNRLKKLLESLKQAEDEWLSQAGSGAISRMASGNVSPMLRSKTNALASPSRPGSGIRPGSSRGNPLMEHLQSRLPAGSTPTTPRPGAASRAASSVGSMSMAGGRVGGKERTAEDIAVILHYVSESMRLLPFSVLEELGPHAEFGQLRKDVEIYRMESPADTVHLLLAGLVELSTPLPAGPGAPRNNKKVITCLKRGALVGDNCALRGPGAPHDHTAMTLGTAMVASFPADVFVAIAGPYFLEERRKAISFLQQNVRCLARLDVGPLEKLAQELVVHKFPEKHEWSPETETMIHFVVKGSAALEAIDRRAPLPDAATTIQRTAGVPTLETHGILANVEIHDGRAVGTLGQDAVLRELRRAMIPKRLLCTLDRGAFFGGGKDIIGIGEFQSCLKVYSATPLTVYTISVTDIIKHMSDNQVLEALREDAAFTMTYFFGRAGMTDPHEVIGHPETSIAQEARERARRQAHEAMQASKGKKNKRGRLITADVGKGGAKGKGRKGKGPPDATVAKIGERKAGKAGRRPRAEQRGEYAKYSKLFDTCIATYQALQREHVQETAAACYNGGTPTDRFWGSSNFTATRASKALAPMLGDIYPDRLTPLAEKLAAVQGVVSAAASRAQSREASSRSNAGPRLKVNFGTAPDKELGPPSGDASGALSPDALPRARLAVPPAFADAAPDTLRPRSPSRASPRPRSSGSPPQRSPSGSGRRRMLRIGSQAGDEPHAATSNEDRPAPPHALHRAGSGVLEGEASRGGISPPRRAPPGEDDDGGPADEDTSWPPRGPRESAGSSKGGSARATDEEGMPKGLARHLTVNSRFGQLARSNRTSAVGFDGGRLARPGELVAACVLWDRGTRPHTPVVRQLLTYEEMHVRKLQHASMTAEGIDSRAAESHSRSTAGFPQPQMKGRQRATGLSASMG